MESGLLDRKEYLKVNDYGSGILYFNVNGEEFAEELSKYLKEHRGYRVVKMMPDTYASYPCGYIVMIEKV
jgi:F420-0:gamma-glutamyl ligase-like protein